MLYPIVLTLHSWLRWIVLGLGLGVTVTSARARGRSGTYERSHDRLGLFFVAALDLQLTLGLVMYLWLSPITRLAFQDPGGAMRTSALRFFLVEHVFSMVLALACAHVGRVRVRRSTSDADKHKRAAWGAGLALVCILVGIPWPFMPYARPLARLSVEEAPRQELSGAALEETRKLYESRCGPCHGANGRGDGPAAVNLVPRPRDFGDPQWQTATKDESIERIIREGGRPVGKSMMMPANPDLDEATVKALRAYIRRMSRH
ncbi:cytochrome c [Polyangium sp. 15x6]|uniref:c-type cytochrome n=1 Tax=Polyangium sp. 15x6 TaxID=3042687 RepID=UPI002499C11E|nr:cytochrome c [Polyangium sp. 15x6]MDI3286287.1 cytochrome c [Polyangium sp. 15x6]